MSLLTEFAQQTQKVARDNAIKAVVKRTGHRMAWCSPQGATWPCMVYSLRTQRLLGKFDSMEDLLAWARGEHGRQTDWRLVI